MTTVAVERVWWEVAQPDGSLKIHHDRASIAAGVPHRERRRVETVPAAFEVIEDGVTIAVVSTARHAAAIQREGQGRTVRVVPADMVP